MNITTICKVTYNISGDPASVYIKDWSDAKKFLEQYGRGEIDVITFRSERPLNWSWDPEGVSYDTLVYGAGKVTDVTKRRRVYKTNGSSLEKSYEWFSHTLGFVPECHFVYITNRGTISFYAGKPDEIRALRNACREAGFKMARSLSEIEL